MLIKIMSKFNAQYFPLDDTAIEVDRETLQQIGITKCFDVENNCVIDYDNTEDLRKEQLQRIRSRRESECFSIINRGELWYKHLTEEQIEELDTWYQSWLDAPETLIIPEKPEWL